MRFARAARRGLSLLEVMVVIAIVLALTAVLIPTGRALFELNQRSAARKLAMAFERLHDEAIMRNRSFRVTFLLDENKYVIEPGEAGALIAAGPEEREAYEARVKAKLAMMDEEEKRQWLLRNKQPFELLEVAGKMEVELPNGIRFGGFYTPQYGHIVKPGEKLEGMEKDEPLKLFTYMMNSGYAEHTIVWLTEAHDPDDGWTVEVEPLSGAVKLYGELIQPDKEYAFVPENGPSLPN
jgi:prepilin-type N-terminal cleavage/methylation domain-containing protein